MRRHEPERVSRRARRGCVCLGRALGLFVALLLGAGAAAPAVAPAPATVSGPPAASEAARTVFVTSNGWHTGIVFARSDLPAGRIPEAADFPRARFLEVGWGDADYYPAERPTIGMTLRAALVPTATVLHVNGLGRSPERHYSKVEVIRLTIDGAGLARLAVFIDASFARGAETRAAAVGPGLYPTSRFYPAKGRFHLGNTCNTWTANALAQAGLAVTADGTTTAEDLMVQVRRIATSPRAEPAGLRRRARHLAITPKKSYSGYR